MQEKKYSCYTRLRRNHSLLLLKNCKSPKPVSDNSSLFKKGPSLVQEKNPKVMFRFKKLVSKVDVIKQAFKKSGILT